MTARVQIRPMTPADIPAVVALADSLPAAPHWPASTYEAALNPAGLPPRIAQVAECHDAEVAGFVIVSLAGSEAELESIAVASGLQRQGIARALLRRLVSHLSGVGIRELFLEVRASNQPARCLYLSLGFQESGRRPGYYANPPEDALVMSLQIGEGAPMPRPEP